MTARERMIEALAAWVRNLSAEEHERYNQGEIPAFSVLKEQVTAAIERAISDAVEEEKEAAQLEGAAHGWDAAAVLLASGVPASAAPMFHENAAELRRQATVIRARGAK